MKRQLGFRIATKKVDWFNRPSSYQKSKQLIFIELKLYILILCVHVFQFTLLPRWVKRRLYILCCRKKSGASESTRSPLSGATLLDFLPLGFGKVPRDQPSCLTRSLQGLEHQSNSFSLVEFLLLKTHGGEACPVEPSGYLVASALDADNEIWLTCQLYPTAIKLSNFLPVSVVLRIW